jgi:hypothetical protein
MEEKVRRESMAMDRTGSTCTLLYMYFLYFQLRA